MHYESYQVESLIITHGLALLPANPYIMSQFGVYLNEDEQDDDLFLDEDRGGKGTPDPRQKKPHYYIYKTPLRIDVRASSIVRADTEALTEYNRFLKLLPTTKSPLFEKIDIVRKEPVTFTHHATGGIVIGGATDTTQFDFTKFIETYF